MADALVFLTVNCLAVLALQATRNGPIRLPRRPEEVQALLQNYRAKTLAPYTKAERDAGTMSVDCTHPSARQLTHHMKDPAHRALSAAAPEQYGAYSSTDFVFNALVTRNPTLFSAHELITNHFDVDSCLSVFCAMEPHLALGAGAKHHTILVEAARIGDFRELQLGTVEQDLALRLCCWMNSLEKK